MDKFKKPYNSSRSRGPSRPSFGAPTERPKFGYSGGDFQHKPPMKKYDAVCSTCGKRCEVPFRPDGSRPVYCTDCFGAPHDAHTDGSKSKFPSRDFSARPSYGPPAGGKSLADLERQIGAMNTKIDTMLRILETMHPRIENAAPASFVAASAPVKNEPAFPVPANVTAPRKFAKKTSSARPAKKFTGKPRTMKRK
jgi:CxxC-x17-CxxC domain-containing protein